MKTTKRILSILLALALGMALCMPVFAADGSAAQSILANEQDLPEGEEEIDDDAWPWWQWLLVVVLGLPAIGAVTFFLPALAIFFPISLPVLYLFAWLTGRVDFSNFF